MSRPAWRARKAALVLALCVLCAFVVNLRADDWPQWRGPNRDGVSAEKNLKKQWPQGGPKLAWQINTLGLGYSGPAVVGDRVYIMGTKAKDDVLFCLDAANGKEQWAKKVGPLFDFKGNSWGPGPRATPTVDGEFVYALGGFGDLVCFKRADGAQVWAQNMTQGLGGQVNPIGGGQGGWGYTWSPLVDGDQLICVPGGPQGLLAALDKKTGNVLWRSKNVTEGATYSSPVLLDVGGVKQVIATTNAGVVGVDAKNGNLLWSYDKAYKDVVIPTPIVGDGLVFQTVGLLNFRPGVDAFKVPPAGQAKAVKAYVNQDLVSGVATPVKVGEHVYGYSESKRNTGWMCMEFASGKVVWVAPDFEQGSVVAADGMLFCYGEETGKVTLAEASPMGWKTHGEFTIPQKSKNLAPSGKLWTPPVVANGMLYLRDQELLFCYEVK